MISWKALTIALLLFVLPNFLLMKVELIGTVEPVMAIGTVLDLAILLPLVCYFFVLRRKPTFFIIIPLSLVGLLTANWFVPDYADQYLNMINKYVIIIEVSLILLELAIMIFILKRIPLLKRVTAQKQQTYYHFLRSFIEASQRVFTFRFKKLNQYQNFLRVLSTDLSVFYYVFFSWGKKKQERLQCLHQNTLTFTYHKNGEYLGVFIMLVHALTIEIIAVHLMVMQYSHAAAWVLTALDIYALLFIIADYQAIRLSPVILDKKGIHIQKGLRFHAFIPYERIDQIIENNKDAKSVNKEKGTFNLTLGGLEAVNPKYKLILDQPIQAYSLFGIRKFIDAVYITVDENQKFYSEVNEILLKNQA